MSINIDELPGVEVRNAYFYTSIPPRISAVYFLVSRKHGLIYVGKASDLRGRWRIHDRLCDALILGDVCLRWLAVPKEELATIEKSMIKALKPPDQRGSEQNWGGPTPLDVALGRTDSSHWPEIGMGRDTA